MFSCPCQELPVHSRSLRCTNKQVAWWSVSTDRATSGAREANDMQSAVMTSSVSSSGDASVTGQHTVATQGDTQETVHLMGRGNISAEAEDSFEMTPGDDSTSIPSSAVVLSEHLTPDTSKSKATGSDFSHQSAEALDCHHNSQPSLPIRKRGRPPKLKGQEKSPVVSSLKRKPGRPPKAKPSTVNSYGSDSMNLPVSSEECSRHHDSPQKKKLRLDGSDSDSCESSGLDVSGKGCRGQRVKHKPNYDESVGDCASDEFLEGEKDQELQEGDHSQGQTVKKGRGRPRKSSCVSQQAHIDQSAPEILGTSPPSRRRGRPRKGKSDKINGMLTVIIAYMYR